MDHIVQRVLRFDRFTLDLTRGCLRAGDRDIDLRPNVTVCDDSLVQCIGELRYKLGDNDRRLIKTVFRRGYLMDAAMSTQALQSLSDGSRVQMPEAPQKLATELRGPLRALWPITTHKLRVWGAATLMPSLI